MAWGDPTSLKFNTDEMTNMRKKIQETSTDLKSFKTQLIKNFEKLKKKWNTEAGRNFTREVDQEWASQVDKYVKIIDAVDELLSIAEKNYKEVADKAKKISF